MDQLEGLFHDGSGEPFNFDEWHEATAPAPLPANPKMKAIASRAELLVDYIKRINELPSGTALTEVRPIVEAAWKAGFRRPDEVSTLEGVILTRRGSLIGIKANAVAAMFSDIARTDLNERREASSNWRDKLQRSERDRVPIANAFNCAVALSGYFDGGIRHDSFTDKVYIREMPGGEEKVLDDHLHFRLLTTIQANGFPQARKSDTADAVHAVARQNSSNALADKLNSLQWDSVPRIEVCWPQYCHVEDTRYMREVGRITLAQAVARAFKPGCKADHISVLVGKQGLLKSTMWRQLSYGWYREFTDDFNHKDGLQQMRGCWFVELAELSSMNRKEVGQVKAFLTKQEDNYRKSYGREDQEYAREFTLCGSANPLPFLKDYTGSRRFLCSGVQKRIDIAGLASVRDQIWAEAVHRYQAGEKWHCDEPWFNTAQEAANEQWTELHPWFEAIERYVLAGEQDGQRRRYVRSAEDVLTYLGVKVSDQRQDHKNKVGEILVKLGYEGNRTIRANGDRFTGYKLIDD